jgi:hypothetical protein
VLSASSISVVTDAATSATNALTFIFQSSNVRFPVMPPVPQPADAPQCGVLTVSGSDWDIASYGTHTFQFDGSWQRCR